MIIGGEFRFSTPIDLSINPTTGGRVLVIGSCLAAGISHWSHVVTPDVGYDYILFNMASDLPEQPPQPFEDYRYGLVLLPLRSILPEGLLFQIDLSDPDSGQKTFDYACELLRALLDSALSYNERSGMLTIVTNFLVPQSNLYGRVLPRYSLHNPAYMVERLNAFLEQECRERKNVYMLDMDAISSSLGRRYIQDDVLQLTNHGAFLNDWDHQFDQDRLKIPDPITQNLPVKVDDFIRSLWSEADAIYRTVTQVDQVKIVIFDLDDTLWRGIMAEGAINSPYLTEGWPTGLLEAVKVLKQRGVLLAIASKNTEDVILGVWDHVFRGLLSIEDFAIRKINWKSKAENIAEILEIANLLPRSAVFVDDNPVEREVVQSAFPDIRTLGSEVYNVRRALLWSPETQVAVVTSESSKRTEMMHGQVQRETERKKLTREEFLQSVELKIEANLIKSAEDASYARALELLNKTNQFNTTGKRWAHDEIVGLFSSGGYLMTYMVKDRFTSYGLVAVGVVRGDEISQFVMSCRVVGLDVELAAMADICNRISATGLIPRGVLIDTDANLLSRDLFAKAGFDENLSASGVIPMPEHVTFTLGQPKIMVG